MPRGRGLMVAPLDPAQVRDLLEVRATLDGLASAKVAEVAANIAKKERIARNHIAHASDVLAGRLEQHLNQNKQPPAKTVRRVNLAA